MERRQVATRRHGEKRIMGSYKIGQEEIIEKLEQALDSLEGDFTDRELIDCLDVMKHYPYVSDIDKDEGYYYEAKSNAISMNDDKR
jgi:hypothetical protein